MTKWFFWHLFKLGIFFTRFASKKVPRFLVVSYPTNDDIKQRLLNLGLNIRIQQIIIIFVSYFF
jgi:hypothetical protein